MASVIRQNYHEDCEALVNKQINLELYSSYVYLSMSYYFERDDVSLPGFSKFFKKSNSEKQEQVQKFMKYQNERGGSIVLQQIKAPNISVWGNGAEAMKAALELEKQVNENLLTLHKKASERNDPHLTELVEDEFLEEQVETIKQLSDYMTRLQRAGTGLGEYIFDKHLQD